MIRSEELVDVSAPRLVEAEAVALPSTTETTVLSAVGHASACDVWFKVPTAWESVVTLRLYGRLADARVLLKTVRIDESHRSTAGGVVSGIAISVRGRPVTAFELTAQATTTTLTGGIFMFQVWSANDAPLITGGITSAAQQATEERIVAHLAVRNGTAPVLASGDASGRTLVAGAGTAGAPAGGVLSIQGGGAGGVVTNRAVRGGGVMYSVVSPTVVKPSVAAVATTWLMTLRSNAAKRVEVQRIIVTYHGLAAASAADGRIIICRSANAPTGGAAATPQAFDAADGSASSAALTFSAVTALALTGQVDLVSLGVRCDTRDRFVYDADAWGKPLVLRPSPLETLGIRFVVDTVAAGQTFGLHVTLIFIEV